MVSILTQHVCTNIPYTNINTHTCTHTHFQCSFHKFLAIEAQNAYFSKSRAIIRPTFAGSLNYPKEPMVIYDILKLNKNYVLLDTVKFEGKF